MGSGWEDRAAYCPVCAAPLAPRVVFGRPRKCCTACDYVQFRSPACAVAVVVARGREILMIRRGIEPYRGCWGLPGGYQDYHEGPQEAAVREVREETGIVARIERLLELCYTQDDPRKRTNVAVYLARPVGGRLRAGDDADDARYFALDALPENVAFENNRRILTKLLETCPSGDIE